MAFAAALASTAALSLSQATPRMRRRLLRCSSMSKLQEFDYASATSIALVMLAAAFLILFINAVLQSRSSKIISGIE